MLKILRSKKGFTMVEMVVVIAIIAIMTSVMMIMMNIGGEKVNDFESRAKAFYYQLQYSMTDLKTNGVAAPSGNVLFWAEVDTSGNVVNLQCDVTGTMSSLVGTSFEAADHSIRKQLPENTVQDKSNIYYYALVDSSFRVEKTFCSLASYSEVSADFTLSADNIISGKMIGAYPTTCGASGQKINV